MRLVVVLPLHPLAVGEGFPLSRWPLHLTVAPTFVIDGDLPAVVAAIGPELSDVPFFEIRVGADEGFGRANRIPVSLTEPSVGLTALHCRLVAALSATGAVFDDPDFIGRGYRPHVTMTKLDRVHPGQLLRLEQAAVVDMDPVGPQRLRNVVWQVPLDLAESHAM